MTSTESAKHIVNQLDPFASVPPASALDCCTPTNWLSSAPMKIPGAPLRAPVGATMARASVLSTLGSPPLSPPLDDDSSSSDGVVVGGDSGGGIKYYRGPRRLFADDGDDDKKKPNKSK